MHVKPFRGLRPRADLAEKIPSHPYDVLSAAEARRLAQDDPYSFLHVIRPEVDLDPGIDPHDDRVYAKGRENFRSMIDQGWLVRDEKPAYYVYRLTMGDHTQTGIMGAAAVADYREGRIKKHEHTRPDKERDRIRLGDALSAHAGPVFLTYEGSPEIDAMVETTVLDEPPFRCTTREGVVHELWVVDDENSRTRLESYFSDVDATYVADGHHRTAAAAAIGARRVEALERSTGLEPANYFLAAHFPASQLKVLDYNRVVKDLNGLTPDGLLNRLRDAGFEIRADHAGKRPPERGSFGLYLAGRWYLLTHPDIAKASGVLERLDVSFLFDRLLQPILGIGDPRTDKRIDFVGGIRGMEELERRVDSGDHELAVAVYPTSLAEVMQVADAGLVMPPKSTWFEPKLRSGIVVQQIDGDTL